MNNTFGPSLKFRVVDKQTGETSEPVTLGTLVSSRAIFERNERGIFQTDEWKLPHSESEPIISHFTGILDSNKSEIYSGDVLYDADNEDQPFLLVYWDENDAQYRADPLMDWNTGEVQRMMFKEHESDFATNALYMPVIGNIWTPWAVVNERMKELRNA